VTFGLTKDYEQIASAYTGVLADQEQDGPVYAYYLENGSNYDIYFLSDSAIYAPKDSSNLFKDMKALKTVNTANFNVSRVENMSDMFAGNNALTTLDVSKWDTSNVTTMNELFYGCFVLNGLDVTNWNVSNVTNLHRAFAQNRALTRLDVSNWDVRKVTTTAKMFYDDYSLVELIGLGNWKTESLTACNSMFSSGSANKGNMPFTDLDIENWDMSEVTQMQCMFYGCGSLTKMDLSNWDVSKVVDMHHMFCDCYNLTDINFENWNTGSVTCFSAMFNNCNSLKVVDVSSFDTYNTDDIEQMFEYCYNLEKIIGLDKWETSKFFSLYEAFSCCYKLKELDLSTWDTSAVNRTFRAFNGCTSLETIYVGDGWDMSNVTKSTDAMFASCDVLVGGKGTTFMGSDLKYAHVDGGAENPGYLTYKPAQNP
jgi:surface protein